MARRDKAVSRCYNRIFSIGTCFQSRQADAPAPNSLRNRIFNLLVDHSARPRFTDHMSHKLDDVFSALSDPTRRAILSMLLEDDMAVTDVAAPFEMSLAAISKHLSILTRAGLISQEKRGRVKWCRLEPDALRDASVWMQGFGQFDPVDVEALEKLIARLGA